MKNEIALDKRITVIKTQNNLICVDIKELWRYKDLIFLFVKRNYTTRYKQTILGPLWLLLNPLFSTILYSVVFSGVAHLSTDDVPVLLFYMSGNIFWSLFASCLSQTSTTFLSNAGIMGKVYFPRLVMPISTVITSVLDFLIQFCLFVGIYMIYLLRGEKFSINIWILAIPIVIIQMAILGLGFGIIVSSLTTKYRDLNILVGFGMQLWMYATPVVYSYSLIPEWIRGIYLLNPVTPGLLIFKHALLGIGQVPFKAWGISWAVTIVILLCGVIIFNKVEKTFMDTV